MNTYNPLDITLNAEEKFYDSADLEKFRTEDSQVIYDHLLEQMKLVSFGDFMKRYIYMKAGFDEPFETVDIKEYQSIIVHCFRENGTPMSFTGTSSKPSVLAKNWLTQSSVSRNVVLLLGFGLAMTEEDVSMFLRKALRERDFDFKNPFEIICWYCFKNKLRYSSFVELYNKYLGLYENGMNEILLDKTMGVKSKFAVINDEDSLMEQLSYLKFSHKTERISVTSKSWFSHLYNQTCEIIAGAFNEDEIEKTEEKIHDYVRKTENSLRLSVEEKSREIQRIRKEAKIWTAEDITENDIEKFIYGGVPIDKNGNLKKFSVSTLAKQFDNKRLNRQHLHDINSGKSDIDRFDLITLSFFVISQDSDLENPQKRFSEFVGYTDSILEDCSMGKLYIANPYECFLLLCILTDCPLGTYAEVFEKSYLEGTE